MISAVRRVGQAPGAVQAGYVIVVGRMSSSSIMAPVERACSQSNVLPRSGCINPSALAGLRLAKERCGGVGGS